jgi:hypothetical protein
VPHLRPVLLAAALLAAGAPGLAPADAAPARAKAPKAHVSAPSSVVEGDRYVVTIKAPRSADRVLLQHQVTDVLGNATWEVVKRFKVRGHTKLSYRAVAGTAETDVYRAQVVSQGRRPSMSKAARTTVWHWTSLLKFATYDRTPGSYDFMTSFAMNGVQRSGWFAYLGYSSYSTGWTVGRHCTAFRADAGVTDKTKPGASATIQLTADDVPVFTSGPLTPGMTQRVELPLASPYRLAVQAQDTSPEGLQGYPALGSPELLCTGLD